MELFHKALKKGQLLNSIHLPKVPNSPYPVKFLEQYMQEFRIDQRFSLQALQVLKHQNLRS